MSQLKVSFLILTYNQIDFVEHALNGAFSQTYSPLEIVISDDASTDGTREKIKEMVAQYSGPHSVKTYFNDENLGFIDHLTLAIDRCSADFIVYGPGDDISLSNRTEILAGEFMKSKSLLIHSDAFEIDDQGNKKDHILSKKHKLDNISIKEASLLPGLCIGATCAWHKDLMNIFGPIVERDTYEDLIFYFRAMLLNKVSYVEKPLIYYRVGNGISQKKRRSNQEARLQAEQKYCRHRLATLRQRLRDVKMVNNVPKDVISTLDQKIAKYEIISALLEKREIFPEKSRFSIGYLAAYLSYIWKIIRIKRG